MALTPEMESAKEVRKTWIEEHLPYEIKMLNGAHQVLDWSDTPPPEGLERNAMIESFCVHARTLIEIFEQADTVHRNGSGMDKWKSLVVGFKISGDYGETSIMLNNQISHLGELRGRDPAKKINRQVRVKLVADLRKDLVRFKECLKPEYRSPPLPDIVDRSAAAPPAYLAVKPGAVSATNAVTGTTVSFQGVGPSTTTTTNIDTVSASSAALKVPPKVIGRMMKKPDGGED